MVNWINNEDLSEENTAKLLSGRGACYRSDAKYLASLTGNEVPAAKRNFVKALHYTNNASELGLDPFELGVFARMLSALAEGTRFAIHPSLDPYHGENAATHSLQCVNLMEKIIHQSMQQLSAEERAAASQDVAPLRQFAGITLLLHDMGEVLGEAGYATAEGATMEEGFDKVELERIILHRTMEMAISSVENEQPLEAFLNTLGEMRDRLQIENKAKTGGLITRQSITDVLTDEKYAHPPLSQKGQQTLHQMMALWEMAEQPDKCQALVETDVTMPDNPEFTGQFVKAIEHMQGTRHLTRFARKSAGEKGLLEQLKANLPASAADNLGGNFPEKWKRCIPPAVADALTQAEEESKKGAIHEIDEETLPKNFNYNEGDIAPLFELANPQSPFQQSLIRMTRNNIYASLMDYVDAVLNVHKRTDIARVKGDDAKQSEIADAFLTKLEGIHTAYERAIIEDRIPEKGERSLGVKVWEALNNTKSSPGTSVTQITPNGMSLEEYLEQRRALSDEGRAA